MGKLLQVLAGLFSSVVGLVIFALTLFSLPLTMIAIMRFTGWEWWGALIGAIVGGAIPIVGQIGYVVLTLLGAYYYIDADFSWRQAIRPGVEAISIGDMTPVEFDQLKARGIRPEIERQCKEAARDRIGTEAIPLVVANYCECQARVIAETTTQKDLLHQEQTGQASTGFEQRIIAAVNAQCGLATP